MTTTKRLRAILDERGVDWISGDTEVSRNICTNFRPDAGVTISVWESGDGKLGIDAHTDYRFTPEQAIAATLGRETCHDIGYRMDSTRFKCSQCGWDGWVRHAKDGRDYKPLWCPLCGAKVVDE